MFGSCSFCLNVYSKITLFATKSSVLHKTFYKITILGAFLHKKTFLICAKQKSPCAGDF